jgi:Arc/MetJ-type ribon-helix-helix transcriptional regulator
MKRITISLPDELATAVEREARRRRVSVSAVARRALAERLGAVDGARRRLPFVALGRSGERNVARDAEEVLAREWAGHIDRDR